MDTSTFVIALSALVTAVATLAIACNAYATSKMMKKTESERNDLYLALVISNLLCSPSMDNSRLYPAAKEAFIRDYTGKTPIFKTENIKLK